MLITSFLISSPSLKFTIILYLSDMTISTLLILAVRRTRHTCNLYRAQLITSLRSSVVRASDRCTGGHRFNYCRTKIFSLYRSRDMLITSFLNINVLTYLLASLIIDIAIWILLRNTNTISRRITNKTVRKIPVFKQQQRLIRSSQTSKFLKQAVTENHLKQMVLKTSRTKIRSTQKYVKWIKQKEHLVLYRLGLRFLFVFFILPITRFLGCFGVVPDCSGF